MNTRSNACRKQFSDSDCGIGPVPGSCRFHRRHRTYARLGVRVAVAAACSSPLQQPVYIYHLRWLRRPTLLAQTTVLGVDGWRVAAFHLVAAISLVARRRDPQLVSSPLTPISRERRRRHRKQAATVREIDREGQVRGADPQVPDLRGLGVSGSFPWPPPSRTMEMRTRR
jgi:hypothetical protein